MKSWLGPAFSILLLCPWLLGNAGCPNTFAESANKTSDEALLYDAMKQIDDKDFDSAITTLDGMSDDGKDSHDGRVAYASAYVGRCGLLLIDLASDVSDGLGSGDQIMKILLSSFRSKTSYADCKTAETYLTGIPAAKRTTDDQVFLAFTEFAKIGAVLAASGADDDNNGAGDTSPAFNPCNDAASDIVEADVREVGTGLTLAYNALSDSGVGIAGDMITKMDAICQSFDCDKTTAADFTANEVKAIRTLINANEIGLNMCGGTSSTLSCVCL